MSAHTPGGWKAISWRDPPAAGPTTVVVPDPSHFSGVRAIGSFERAEDAIVAAAAPDLLKVAQAAWNCIAEMAPTQARAECARMLQAAIAKAGAGHE